MSSQVGNHRVTGRKMNFPSREIRTRCTSPHIATHSEARSRAFGGHSERDCTAILQNHHCTQRRRGVQVPVGLPNVQPIPSISVNNSVLLTLSLARQRGRPDPVRLKSKPPLNAVSVAHALDVCRGGDRWSNLRLARCVGYLSNRAGWISCCHLLVKGSLIVASRSLLLIGID